LAFLSFDVFAARCDLLRMRNRPCYLSAARQSSGFTLVELLVVIGIIAILAGVALGPITNGIKKAKESGAMQTCRTLALAEFQSANDNNGTYPDGADAGVIAQGLVSGNYISDPTIFVISGDNETVKAVTNTSITKANVTFNFTGVAGTGNPTAGVGSSAPDQLPLVWTPDPGAVLPAADNTGTAFAPSPTGLFGTDGIAVAYHSNNAFFRAPQSQVTPVFPGQGKAIFVDNTAAGIAGAGYMARYGSRGY
jgi:prepilin-type N-terminal cleavage/methylation domain-containing protein